MRQIFRIALAMALATLFMGLTSEAQTQPAVRSEDAAIRQTALDYIAGWFAGDAARLERALHPELAKRMVYTDPHGRSRLEQMSAMTLVQTTRAGGGKRTPKGQQQKDITILDRFNNAAVVKIVASGWADYLEVVKFEGQWKIINVLWELKAPPASQKSSIPGQ
jgi:hypothetical protein